ncbi:MAG: hypothetical protein QW085_05925, partial [Pyrobaculum sp.]
MERRRGWFEDARRELEERRRRLEKLKERRTHALLLLRLCILASDVARVAGELEPLKPIREWLRKEPPIALLAVADKPMVVVEPETGAVHICGALCTVVGGPVGARVWLLLASPGLSLLSDRAVRSTLAHELLHMGTLRDEWEVDRRVDEAARLRPELFATIGEVDREELEEVGPIILAGKPYVDVHVLPIDPSLLTWRELLSMISVQMPLAPCVER